MRLANIRPTPIALLVAALFILLVGSSTDNAGFQAAGLLILFVGAITAINEARAGGDLRSRSDK